MSLAPPQTVGKLQAALHAKAKGCPSYRFYSLYDKVYRPDILAHAYARSKANGGAPGVDGRTFDDIEAYGRDRWLGELAERRVRRWLCRKHKKAGRGMKTYPDAMLYGELGLVELPKLRSGLLRAKA